MYNIAVSELIKANNSTNPYALIPGSILNIPLGRPNIFNYYTVLAGDTLYKISQEANISVDLLTQLNGLKKDEYIYPGQTLLIPKDDVLIYVTKEGDTMNTVGDYFKTYPQNILYSNNDIYLLPGQLIVYRKI